MSTPAVRFEDVRKRFPGSVALDGVTLEIAEGSCHALCGENGAGKSTLGKILAGIHAPDGGRVLVHGREVRFGGPRDALAAGVGMVHQELAFCDNLSVAENLCLGALPARRGWTDPAETIRQAEALLAETGAELDVRRPLGELSTAQRQLVQIAAAVGGGARIIIFDEPTSSLGQHDAERLYALIGRLRARGVTCIYVSHRMPEIFHLCDAVSVLRDGRHVATRPTAGLTEAELVRMMIGRPAAEYLPAPPMTGEATELLRVDGLTSPGRFHDVACTLHAGEVVGLAGLVGAGRSEVAEAIFGLDPAARGSVWVEGKPVRIRTPRQAIELGLGLVPEDRKKQGLVLGASGVHNTSLPILRRLSPGGWIRRRAERALAVDYFGRMKVRTPSPETPVAGLSGGNQQKVVLARWLAAQSRILMLDEPTRGVDVGAKAEIHALITELAARGSAVLLISSELPELLALSTRIVVLRGGRIAGELHRAEATQDRLLRMMAGLADEAPSSTGAGSMEN
ncbi:ATP-binding cassette domain-containing protein [Longimicrobium terrae]|uniref:ABC-type sugar transport system ATPase subunit n=1 Tax=Longimicrobium terrae TaxID=1639882 RepID=A0A841H3W8_9BACT|nr:ABC-type sugar transport system ATPase subunit [Longimicrobium terrae]MBB6072663.1 ABC-type sugar transport system ATPase subunit [Longimicrobium terrae]NNC32461.1 sugar ABC transporter ATP-binding protein [Longimicrobium terrae]